MGNTHRLGVCCRDCCRRLDVNAFDMAVCLVPHGGGLSGGTVGHHIAGSPGDRARAQTVWLRSRIFIPVMEQPVRLCHAPSREIGRPRAFHPCIHHDCQRRKRHIVPKRTDAENRDPRDFPVRFAIPRCHRFIAARAEMDRARRRAPSSGKPLVADASKP